jgi:hypothetical protein
LLSLLCTTSWAVLVAEQTKIMLMWRYRRYERALCDRSFDLEAATTVARYTTMPYGTQGTYRNFHPCFVTYRRLLHRTPLGVTPIPAIPSAFLPCVQPCFAHFSPLRSSFGSIARPGKRGSRIKDARVRFMRAALFSLHANKHTLHFVLLIVPHRWLVLVANTTNNAAQVNNVIIAGNDDQDF